MSRQMIKLDCAEDKTEPGHSPLQAALGWRALIQPETGKVTKSQTREGARERPEGWRNLASCRNSPCVLKANGQDVRGPVVVVVVVRAEAREVAGSWPLRWNSAFIRLWDSRAWTVFGIASRSHCVCVDRSTDFPQGNREKSEPCKRPHSSSGCRSGTTWPSPASPTVSPLEWPTPFWTSQLCSLVTSLPIWVVTPVWLPHPVSFSLFWVILPSSVSLTTHPAKL